MASLQEVIITEVPESRLKVKRKHLNPIKIVGSFGRPLGQLEIASTLLVHNECSIANAAILWSLGGAGSVLVYLVIVSEEVFAFYLSPPHLHPDSTFFCRPNKGTYCTESRWNGVSKWTVQAYCVLDHYGRDLCMGFGIFPFILMHTATSDLNFLNSACS